MLVNYQVDFIKEASQNSTAMAKADLRIVGVYEAAEILGGVSNQYVDQLARSGKLPIFRHLKCGRIFLYEDVYKLKKKIKI